MMPHFLFSIQAATESPKKQVIPIGVQRHKLSRIPVEGTRSILSEAKERVAKIAFASLKMVIRQVQPFATALAACEISAPRKSPLAHQTRKHRQRNAKAKSNKIKHRSGNEAKQCIRESDHYFWPSFAFSRTVIAAATKPPASARFAGKMSVLPALARLPNCSIYFSATFRFAASMPPSELSAAAT